MKLKGNIRKALFVTLWGVMGTAILVLLLAAITRRNNRSCKAYVIEFTPKSSEATIDKKELINVLTKNGQDKLTGKAISSFNLKNMEESISRNPWVEKAMLFFDNNEVLRIRITQREPVARVFTLGGSSFYMDSNGVQLPLSEKLVLRLPVFTGYPYEKLRTRGADSLLFVQMKSLSSFIRSDPFWNAQIAQADITPSRTFELSPVVGNHLINLGEATDLERKFHRLFLFYKEVLSRTGFDRYAKIDVAYDGQVVGTRKGSGIPKSDSLQAIKNIQQLIRSARQMQEDTLRSQHVNPLERNTETEQTLTNYDLIPSSGDSIQNAPPAAIHPTLEKPIKKTATSQSRPVSRSNIPMPKPKALPIHVNSQKPRAVMPPKN